MLAAALRAMKPARFEYERPDDIASAVSLLAQSEGEARVLAGGQSLVPMMNLRLARPSVLVDIGVAMGPVIASIASSQVSAKASGRGAIFSMSIPIRTRGFTARADMATLSEWVRLTVRNRASGKRSAKSPRTTREGAPCSSFAARRASGVGRSPYWA